MSSFFTSATVSNGPTYKRRVWLRYALSSSLSYDYTRLFVILGIHMNELDVNFIGIDTKCSCDLLPTSDVVKCLSL